MKSGDKSQIWVEGLQRRQAAIALRDDPAWMLRYTKLHHRLASLHAFPYDQAVGGGGDFEKTINALTNELEELSK